MCGYVDVADIRSCQSDVEGVDSHLVVVEGVHNILE